MINIKDIKPNTFKASFPIERATFQWHNKNKQGGNFGYNLIYPQLNEYGHKITFMLSGYYNKDGNIWSMRLSKGFNAGFKLPIWSLESMNVLIDYIKRSQAWEDGKAPSPEVKESELLTEKEQLKLLGFEVI